MAAPGVGFQDQRLLARPGRRGCGSSCRSRVAKYKPAHRRLGGPRQGSDSDSRRRPAPRAAYLRDLHEALRRLVSRDGGLQTPGEGKDRSFAPWRGAPQQGLLGDRPRRVTSAPRTKSYVPAILASILIDKSPGDFTAFNVDIDSPLKVGDGRGIDRPTDLQVIADGAGGQRSRTISKLLNPELRRAGDPSPAAVYKGAHSDRHPRHAAREAGRHPRRQAGLLEACTSRARARPSPPSRTKYKVPVKTLVERESALRPASGCRRARCSTCRW